MNWFVWTSQTIVPWFALVAIIFIGLFRELTIRRLLRRVEALEARRGL